MTNGEALREAMRLWTTGVTVASAEYEGVLHGMTVSSFTSVSLTPPLILVSLEIGTRTYNLVKRAGAFGVTILSADQQEVSNCFSNPQTELGDRFAGREVFRLETGAPFVKGGLAFFDCRVSDVYPVGTHAILIGEVIAVSSGGRDDPLLYFNRSYRYLDKK